jgi:nicotinamide-nucleotide amidase
MPSQIVIDCSRIIAERGMTIAFVESATAGRLASEFSLTPSSGEILIGGLICYDACMKEDLLGIPPEMIKEFTPESAEVTRELAHRFKSFMKADIHVAVTGLPSPGGSETAEKPVGTMFVHFCIQDKSIPWRHTFLGKPEEILLQTIDQIADRIKNELTAHTSTSFKL